MAKYNDDKNFDVDLEYGQAREKEVARILEKGKLEVKSERDWWYKTNKIAIEIESYGKPSGITTTKAKYWVHVLCKNNVKYVRLIFDVYILKRLCKKYKDNWQMVGDNQASKVILIPLKELLIYDETITKTN